jgi:hypothetical protein
MSFTSEKENIESDKFFLVYIQPARYLTDDLVSIGSNKYTVTFPFTVDSIEENGTAMTLVSNPTSSGEYAVSGTTITIYTTDTTRHYVAFHSLYFTERVYRYIQSDPLTPSGAVVEWLPQVLKGDSIAVEASIEGALSGLVQYKPTTIQLININASLNVYFGPNDSFFNKVIKIWLCIDNSSNIKLMFDGTISSISLGDVVSFQAKDSLLNFEKTLTMGDDLDEVYLASTTIAGLGQFNTTEEGKPILFAFGRSVGRSYTGKLSGVPFTANTYFDDTYMVEALTADLDGTTDAVVCFRCLDGLADMAPSFTPSAVVTPSPGFYRLTVTTTTASYIDKGDIIWYESGGTIYTATIHVVDRNTGYLYIYALGSFSGTSTAYNHAVGSILYGRDAERGFDALDLTSYVVGENPFLREYGTTAGGNKLITVDAPVDVVVNGSSVAFDPTEHKLYFHARLKDTTTKHGEVLKAIIDSTGSITNASSFTTADSTLDERVLFTVPYRGSSDIGDTRTYIEDILKSTFSYLTFNSSREIVYKLWDAPTSGGVRDDYNIIRGSSSYEISYRDISQKIVATNDNISWIVYGTDAAGITQAYPDYSDESSKAFYIQDNDRILTIKHLLEEFDVVGPRILAAKAEPITTYSWESVGTDLEVEPGDDLTLEFKLLGSESSVNLKVLSTRKTSKKTTIIASELKGIEI